MFHGFLALWFLSCCQMCSFFSELARSSNHRHASIDRVRTATMLFGLLSCSCHTLCSLVSSVESCRTLTGLCSCLACACYVCVYGQCDARGRWCKRLLVAHETVGCDTTVPCTARCWTICSRRRNTPTVTFNVPTTSAMSTNDPPAGGVASTVSYSPTSPSCQPDKNAACSAHLSAAASTTTFGPILSDTDDDLVFDKDSVIFGTDTCQLPPDESLTTQDTPPSSTNM